MSRYLLLLCVVLPLGCDNASMSPDPYLSIPYRGEYYRLTKPYDENGNFDETTEDGTNLHPSENARVAKAVSTAPIPKTASSVVEIVMGTGKAVFPGYESGTMVSMDESQLGNQVGGHIMIPRTGKNRVFIYKKSDGVFKLIQDTQIDREPRISHYRINDDSVTYYSQGDLVHTVPLD